MADASHTLIPREEAIAQGLPRYFTGLPCKRGHICERKVATWKCIECAREINQHHYRNNSDLVRERSRIYYQNNSSKILVREKSRYEKDRSDRTEYARSHRLHDGDKINLSRREKYKNDKDHRDKLLKRQIEYNFKNKEKIKESVKKRSEYFATAARNRRAVKKLASGSHTKNDIKEIFKMQRGRCACCRKRLKKYHVDHIIPLSKGGSNNKENLQILCVTCNLSKNAKDPIKFMQERGMLL